MCCMVLPLYHDRLRLGPSMAGSLHIRVLRPTDCLIALPCQAHFLPDGRQDLHISTRGSSGCKPGSPTHSALAPNLHRAEIWWIVSAANRELLEKLKFELAFVEDGGYGRSVRTPHKPTSPFQDSLTCLNFGDPSRPHPCAECILMQYVPESRKAEDVPCHHIPLDEESGTIATLDAASSEKALKRWLRHEIDRLEGELAV